MSIEKYLKTTPDKVLANTAWASTDGQNLKLYKLSNAGENIGLEWCYSTNFNNSNFIDNSYIRTGIDTVDKAKNNVTYPEIVPLANGRYMGKFDDSEVSWDKINGLAFGVLYWEGFTENFFDSVYVCSNLDYSRLIINTSSWDSSGSGERRYLTDNEDKLTTEGYRALLRCIKTDNTIGDLNYFRIAYASIGNDGLPVVQLYTDDDRNETQVGARWYATSVINAYKDKVHEYPYLTDISLHYPDMIINKYQGKYRKIFTIPHTKQSLIREKEVGRTQYGANYVATYCSSVDVHSWIQFMNSTGLRYYDGGAFTNINDIKANVYMGVMDNDGITDCNSRIKGWAEIENSDLPNVHRNGYEWDVTDPTRPPVDPTKDDTVKMEIGGYYTAGGLVNYYSLVNTPEYRPLDLLSANLSSWDYVATGKDVLKNLVSLKAFPLSRDLLCRGTTKEITIAGTQTGVNGQTVDSTYGIINLGTISIPHRYNDFRDYAPYTKIEVCVPFCGWVSLPSHCMGRTIDVKMTYDIITGSCTVYVILDDNTIVAQACGCIAYDIPFTADAVGMKTAGMINGITGVAGSALSLGTGLVSGNIVGSASGIIGLANSVTQTICANNANYTEVKGNTGDSNNFAGVKKCYLKITYPVSEVPNGYGKTVGYLYNKNVTLTNNLGYTKTANTKISGNMMETEKLEIINLMENGVIL